MRNLITLTIIIIALVAGWDFYQRRVQRAALGPGYALRHGQVLKVKPTQDVMMNSLQSGSEISFRVFPESAYGSTAIGDGILTDARLVARVVKRGYSQTLAHPSLVFEFREIRLPSGQRFRFKGSIHSAEDPAPIGEAPIIGSFVGMEYGPVGIVGGFLLGTLAPHYYGKHYDAPQSYTVRDIRDDEEIYVKVHYADYIPFNLRRVAMVQNRKESSGL